MRRIWEKLWITLEMIKIEHTLFALPFAFLGAFMAAGGLPPLGQTLWILAAMVGARSAAMAFNRLVDLPYDAANPRTVDRALPRGLVSRGFVITFVVASSAFFICAAFMLNPLAFALSPVALALIFFYSYTKRFTSWCHLILGLCLACAPIGAWIAVRGRLSWIPLGLGLAVLLWVAGLDVLYSCQDLEFDRKHSLYSIPKRWGVRIALWLSGVMHLLMVGILGLLFWMSGLGPLSLVGLAVVTVLLGYEHSLVKVADLSRVNAAFFTVNGWISILLFVVTSIDILLAKLR